MDVDIQFGELEESKPEVQLRPDRNKHFVVVPCQSPIDDELPIFVDIDVMRDMEEHALSNTKVELGGVMLGGQYEDENGKPFVVVTDSLRAEHYEATKGSFKFTHETWQAISREREEFPDDLQMVGWYHTHPDWGVFLSGMDMFICDNFFNKKLDLALVIDPCRDDRGWFIWTDESRQSSDRVKRTGGFYLFGSRFRDAELQYFADLFGGESTMASNPRYSPVAGQIGAPVVHLHDSRDSRNSTFLIAMLTMQFMFLALIAWMMLAPSKQQTAEAQTLQSERELEIAANRQVLSSIIKAIDEKTGKSIVDDLVKAKATVNKSQVDALAHKVLSESLQKDLKQRDSTIIKKNKQIDEFSRQKKDLEQDLVNSKKQVTALKKQVDGEAPPVNWMDFRIWIAGFLVALISGIAGFMATLAVRRPDPFDDYDDEDEDDDAASDNAGQAKESSEQKNDTNGINFES